MKPEIKIMSADDWEGIYVDNKLISEGHSLDLKSVLNKLGLNVKSIYLDGNLDEYGNRCPTDWPKELLAK